MEERKNKLTEQEKRLKKNMGRIRHKIAVISGKSGVGKSTQSNSCNQ